MKTRVTSSFCIPYNKGLLEFTYSIFVKPNGKKSGHIELNKPIRTILNRRGYDAKIYEGGKATSIPQHISKYIHRWITAKVNIEKTLKLGRVVEK